jgi:hypothetical protein
MKQPLLDEKFSAAISELIGHCEKMLAQFDMLAEKGKLCEITKNKFYAY